VISNRWSGTRSSDSIPYKNFIWYTFKCSARTHQQGRRDALLDSKHRALRGDHTNGCGSKLRDKEVRCPWVCIEVCAQAILSSSGEMLSVGTLLVWCTGRHTLMASRAYSTWKIRPSGLKVFTPLSYSVNMVAGVKGEPSKGDGGTWRGSHDCSALGLSPAPYQILSRTCWPLNPSSSLASTQFYLCPKYLKCSNK